MMNIKLDQSNARRRICRLRNLQIAIGIASFVPIAAGLSGILWGPHMTGARGAYDLSLDSHFRYMSGLLLGIGLGFVSCIPRLETKTARFQLLALIVVIGGFGRLYSFVEAGSPNGGMLFGLGMELFVTPVLALWQWHHVKRS